MGKVVEYVHHGVMVSVDEDLMGTHRDCCLCYRCGKFTIPMEDEIVSKGISEDDQRAASESNCDKSNRLFEFVKANNMVCPVFECPDFEMRSPTADGD